MFAIRGVLLAVAAMLPAACGQSAAHGAEPRAQPLAADLRRLHTLPPSHWPKAWVDEGTHARELARLPPMAYPTGNSWSESKARLGELLFFDPRLSATGQIACASCHDPQFAWTDGKRRAIGFARFEGPLNTPSIINAGYEQALFWDGRAVSPEAQIAGSLTNSVEMNTPVRRATAAIATISAYRPLLTAAYGDARLDWSRMCDAIATYVRSQTLNDTPYDRFLRGDAAALSDSALRGLHLTRTRARCMNCHNGALLSDGEYHHLGTSSFGVENYQGRFAVTHRAADMGRFRTPGLRGVANTGPWMHSGLIDDLDSLLAQYNKGWWQNARPHGGIEDAMFPRLDPLIGPLGLSHEELTDVKTFLSALSPPSHYKPPPDLPGRSGLPRPLVAGDGRRGSPCPPDGRVRREPVRPVQRARRFLVSRYAASASACRTRSRSAPWLLVAPGRRPPCRFPPWRSRARQNLPTFGRP